MVSGMFSSACLQIRRPGCLRRWQSKRVEDGQPSASDRFRRAFPGCCLAQRRGRTRGARGPMATLRRPRRALARRAGSAIDARDAPRERRAPAARDVPSRHRRTHRARDARLHAFLGRNLDPDNLRDESFVIGEMIHAVHHQQFLAVLARLDHYIH